MPVLDIGYDHADIIASSGGEGCLDQFFGSLLRIRASAVKLFNKSFISTTVSYM